MFILTGSGYPQIFSAPSGETIRQIPKSFRSARTCSRSSITMPIGGARISPDAGAAKNVRFFVCLFVALLGARVREPDFAMKALAYRNDFDAVG